MKKQITLLAVIFLFGYPTKAQISGYAIESIIASPGRNVNPSHATSLYSIQGRDVSMALNIQYHAKILEYVVTLGVSEEAQNVQECSESIDKRIKSFVSDLKKIGIKEDKTFVDAITHNRIYSYTLKEDPQVFQEEMTGFVLKKNIMVRYSDPDQLSPIILLASKQAIYDLIKVDYVVEDRIKVLSDLMPHIDKLVQERQELLRLTGQKSVFKEYEVKGHHVTTHHPLSMYRSYTAQSTNSVTSLPYHYNNVPKISARKETTYYYHPKDPSYFDLVLYGNDNKLTPTVIYEIQVNIGFTAI